MLVVFVEGLVLEVDVNFCFQTRELDRVELIAGFGRLAGAERSGEHSSGSEFPTALPVINPTDRLRDTCCGLGKRTRSRVATCFLPA